MIKIGINGLGRIGRAILRNNLDKNYFKIVLINDINPDIGNIAYTLNYETLYDRLPFVYKVENEKLIDDKGEIIHVTHEKNIENVNWKDYDVDFIIDSSGIYQNVIEAHNLIKNKIAKKIFITHSPDIVDFTMVLGANEEDLDVEKHHVISTSICDATAIAPITKAILKEFGLEYGYVTTLHPWLNYQNLMDGPASSWSVPGEIYHHYALGRSVVGNMIPKPTSAIEATCKVLEKEGITEDIIGSFSYRTPTAIVGSADITFHLGKDTDTNSVLELFKKMEKIQKWKIIHNNMDPLVSLDFKKSEFSAVVDHRWTDVVKGRMLKLVLWYDNEYGYASKVLDQVHLVAEKMNLK